MAFRKASLSKCLKDKKIGITEIREVVWLSTLCHTHTHTPFHRRHELQVKFMYQNVTHHAKRDIMGIVKSIDSGQPVKSYHSRNFSLLADFLCIM